MSKRSRNARDDWEFSSKSIGFNVNNPTLFTVNGSQIARISDIPPPTPPPPAPTYEKLTFKFSAINCGNNSYTDLPFTSMEPPTSPSAGGISFSGTNITITKKGVYNFFFSSKVTETSGAVTFYLLLDGTDPVNGTAYTRSVFDSYFVGPKFTASWSYTALVDATHTLGLQFVSSAATFNLPSPQIDDGFFVIEHTGF